MAYRKAPIKIGRIVGHDPLLAVFARNAYALAIPARMNVTLACASVAYYVRLARLANRADTVFGDRITYYRRSFTVRDGNAAVQLPIVQGYCGFAEPYARKGAATPTCRVRPRNPVARVCEGDISA